jgi:hypothetical protein
MLSKMHALPEPFRARTLYRVLYKRLMLPRPLVHGLLSRAKRLGVRDGVALRRQFASSLPPAGTGEPVLDELTGATHFEPGVLPGSVAAATRCMALYEEYRSSGAAAAELERNPNKRFLLSVVAGNEFAAHPELLRFMVSRPILDAATRYLDAVPRLEGAALWWTPPNDSMKSSQQLHLDELAPRQVKIMLNCSDVTPECGPLHYLPANASAELRRAAHHRRGRLDDRWIESAGMSDRVRTACGPAGSALIFDSSRCLHFGSRGNSRDRLVLTFHFLPLDAPTETRYHVDPPIAAVPALDGLDEHQFLALGLGRRRPPCGAGFIRPLNYDGGIGSTL